MEKPGAGKEARLYSSNRVNDLKRKRSSPFVSFCESASRNSFESCYGLRKRLSPTIYRSTNRKQMVMAKALADIILSDPLVAALENRALREGLLSDQDYKLSEFVTPTVTVPNSAEGTALDLICLYDQAIVESKKFSFQAFAKSFGEGVIYDRGDNIREFSVAYMIGKKAEYEGVNRKEFEGFKSQSAFEAQFILRRDVDYYLRDARAAFESEAPKSRSGKFGFRLRDLALSVGGA